MAASMAKASWCKTEMSSHKAEQPPHVERDAATQQPVGRSSPMKANRKLAIALVAGIAEGGAIIKGLQAKAKPPVYVVVDIADITDAEGFKAIIPLSAPDTLAPFGGRYVIRTDKITALDGTPPKRFVV